MSLWLCTRCGVLYGNVYVCPTCHMSTELAMSSNPDGPAGTFKVFTTAPVPSVPVSALRALINTWGKHCTAGNSIYDECADQLAALCDVANKTEA